MDPWRLLASLNLNMTHFVLIRVILFVRTNTSCRYKRVEPRHIRHTKIDIFDDNLCKIAPKLAVILFWPFQLSIPSHQIDLAILYDIYCIPDSLLQTIILV